VRISQRLYLTVVPAIVGLLLMAALVYWGEYARAAPSLVIFAGGAAVLASLMLTWSNARYVARRIERLAAATPSSSLVAAATDALIPTPAKSAPDEIDEIERVVDRLSSAVQIAAANTADREQLFERRAHDYARLLAELADASARRLEEVRLPLHILLENRFGELNENQEEMLGAARAAAEAVDADMMSLRQIATLDLGERPLRKDSIKPSELIEALRPLLLATAESAGITVEIEIAPLLPAVVGDRALLQDALATLIRSVLSSAAPESRVRVGVDREKRGREGVIRFAILDGGIEPLSVRWAAAARVVQAHGGTVERRVDGLWIDLPIAGAR
jgi:signal transduction histidine kinase